MENLLNELAEKHGTDKGPSRHGYTRHYHHYLHPIRASVTRVLELGVLAGSSLRMWEEYFPNAEIHGVDNEMGCLRQQGGRRFVHVMVQNDPRLIPEVGRAHGPFDLIIDDASHCGDAQEASFQLLYPYVKPGGFYIVEDLQVKWGRFSFIEKAKEYLDKVVFAGKSEWGDPRNNRPNGLQWLEQMDDFERQTRGLYVHQGMVIFEKWGSDEDYSLASHISKR